MRSKDRNGNFKTTDKMKTIYIIRTSTDGVMRQAFSNKKALWDHLEQDNWFNGCDYPLTHIQDHPKNLKLTYANMVKVFKNQLSVWMCDDSGYNTLELMEVNVYSKWQ